MYSLFVGESGRVRSGIGLTRLVRGGETPSVSLVSRFLSVASLISCLSCISCLLCDLFCFCLASVLSLSCLVRVFFSVCPSLCRCLGWCLKQQSSEKTTRERKRAKTGAGEGKKHEILGPSLRAEALRAPTFSGFGPLRSSFYHIVTFSFQFFTVFFLQQYFCFFFQNQVNREEGEGRQNPNPKLVSRVCVEDGGGREGGRGGCYPSLLSPKPQTGLGFGVTTSSKPQLVWGLGV